MFSGRQGVAVGADRATTQARGAVSNAATDDQGKIAASHRRADPAEIVSLALYSAICAVSNAKEHVRPLMRQSWNCVITMAQNSDPIDTSDNAETARNRVSTTP